MGILHNLKLRFSPPRITDPDFGSLLFMFIPNAPERSYWEGEWTFPETGGMVSIGLPGGECGPMSEARQFYLNLPGRFEELLATARPKLEEVLKSWLEQELPQNIFVAVKLTGLGIENLGAGQVEWNIGFETIGEKWLGITVRFVGDEPRDGQAVVDT
jgi:hypothetical protein